MVGGIDIAAGATALVIFAYLITRVIQKIILDPPYVPPLIYGDVCEVPQELRAARRGGGEACREQPARSTRDDIARHIGTGL